MSGKKVKCSAKTVKGTACKNYAMSGSSKCAVHSKVAKPKVAKAKPVNPKTTGAKKTKGKAKGKSKKVTKRSPERVEGKRVATRTIKYINDPVDLEPVDYVIVITGYEDRMVRDNVLVNLKTDKYKTTKRMNDLGAKLIGVRIKEYNQSTDVFSGDATVVEGNIFNMLVKHGPEKFANDSMALFKLKSRKFVLPEKIKAAIDYADTFDVEQMGLFQYFQYNILVLVIGAESG